MAAPKKYYYFEPGRMELLLLLDIVFGKEHFLIRWMELALSQDEGDSEIHNIWVSFSDSSQIFFIVV